MSENLKIKILVGYHKPAELLKDDILTPIHLGRALATEASKDGQMSQEEYDWMCENMIGDDTGDNISHLNRSFCEMTGIYWAWKNYDKLGNPDYIGFMHYRRHLIFKKEKDIVINCQTQNYASMDDNYLNCSMVRNMHCQIDLIKNFDVITTPKFSVKNSIYEHFNILSKNERFLPKMEMLDETIKILKTEKYCDSNIVDSFFSQPLSHLFNVFIFKKDIFFKYCEWIFKILFKLHYNANYSIDNMQEFRTVGYIAERLAGLFLHINNSYKIKTFQLSYIENTDVFIHPKPYFKENNIPIFMATDDNYAPYCSVLLQSIIDNSSNEYNYDIFILFQEKRLSKINRDKLSEINYQRKNFNIRFLDVTDLLINSNFFTHAHFTIETYYRIYAPLIFKNFNKIIYLDIDTIVLDDISKLYNVDFKEKALVACPDIGVYAKIKSNKYEKMDYFIDTVGLDKVYNSYFNAGVLVLDLNAIRDRKLDKLLIDVANNSKFVYVDQDVFNKVFEKDHLLIDTKWNYKTNSGTTKDRMHLAPYLSYFEYMEARKDIKIIHYASHEKPWNVLNTNLSEYWWYYARKTPYYEYLIKNITTCNIDRNFNKTQLNTVKKKYGAKEKVQAHLSYQIGKAFLNSKNPFKALILPFKIISLCLNHKKKMKLKNEVKKYLEQPYEIKLENYADYEEAKKIINGLSYKLGKSFLNNPFKFIIEQKQIRKSYPANQFRYKLEKFLKIQPFFKKDTYLLFDNLYEKNAECIDTYCIFKYMQDNKIKSYYVLWKENPLYEKLKNTNALTNIIVLDRPSKIYGKGYNFDFFYKCYFKLLKVKAVITSFGELDPLITQFLNTNKYIKYISVGHGPVILKKFVLSTGYFTVKKFNYSLIASDKEKETFLKIGDFNENQLIKIGLPRWDLLKKEKSNEKSIFLMLTWRLSFGRFNEKHFNYSLENTDYFKGLYNLLNSERLKNILEKNKIKLKFTLHHALIDQSNFNFSELIKNDYYEYVDPINISKHISNSDLYITDYSSLVFDFAFLNTPIIFFRPDFNDSRLVDIDKEDFKYARSLDDEFFNVCYEYEKVIDLIEKYIEKGFVLENENIAKLERFFYTKENITEKFVDYIEKIK